MLFLKFTYQGAIRFGRREKKKKHLLLIRAFEISEK